MSRDPVTVGIQEGFQVRGGWEVHTGKRGTGHLLIDGDKGQQQPQESILWLARQWDHEK